MTGQRETLLCRYSYDPLDRVVGCAPLNQDSVQRYYRKNRLVTEIQGPVEYSVMEHDQQLLAQQQHQAGRVDSTLLATDLQRSVLHSVSVGQHQKPVYSPYGHRSPASGLLSLLGFNGERREPVTGHYLLGNGYRAFNSVLMRFNSPDSLSPFGKGGVNAYAYCEGNPVNRVDPTGHSFVSVFLGKYLKRAVDSFTPNALTRSAHNFAVTSIASGNTVKKSLISGASPDISTIEALDLAMPENRHLEQIDNLFKAKLEAFDQFNATERDLVSLRGLFRKESLDPTMLSEAPAFKAHVEARALVSKTFTEYGNALAIHLDRYPGQHRKSVARFNLVVRRVSIG
jgi:RHS repeat-associated protein